MTPAPNIIKMADILIESSSSQSEQFKNAKDGIETENDRVLTLETNSKQTDFIFQTCIEQNKHLLASAGSFIKKATDKLPRWHEKYENYKQGKSLLENENCGIEKDVVESRFRNEDRSKKVLTDRMNFSTHTDDVIVARIHEHTSQVKSLNNIEMQDSTAQRGNNVLIKENEGIVANIGIEMGEIMKTPIQRPIYGSVPKSVQNSSSVPVKKYGPSKVLNFAKTNTAENVGKMSHSKGNILRASKLGSTVNNMTKRLSDHSDVVSKNMQKLSDSRTSTPQKANFEQRSNSRSKIPKFLYMSPVPKKPDPYQASKIVGKKMSASNPNQGVRNTTNNAKNLLGSNFTSRAKGIQMTSTNKKYTTGTGPPTSVRRNNPMFKKSSASKDQTQTVQKTIQKPSGITQTRNPPALEKKDTSLTDFQRDTNTVHLGIDYNPETKTCSFRNSFSHEKTVVDIAPDALLAEKDLLCGEQRFISNISSPRAGTPKTRKSNAVQSSTGATFGSENSAEDKMNVTPIRLNGNIDATHTPCVDTDVLCEAGKHENPVTKPNELYTFKDNINGKKQDKAVDFIKLNKEKIKKMPKRRRRSSKNKVGAFKVFKNSIVIDSRYLTIVNKILEENRKCLSCQREREGFNLRRSSRG